MGLCKHRRRSYAPVLLPCAYTHNVEHFVFSKFIMCSPLRLYYYYEKREREKGDASEHHSINGLENDETGKRQRERATVNMYKMACENTHKWSLPFIEK